MSGDEDGDGGGDSPAKEGLKAAIDVTKFTLGVAGAAIAFLISSDTLKSVASPGAKLVITLSLAGFGISAIGGLLVLMQGASNLANADYSLGQPAIRYSGIANIVGLIVGFAFATAYVIGAIWAGDP